MRTIRVIRNGQVISDGGYRFCGVRVLTSQVAGVDCYLCCMGGSLTDPRRGVKLTAKVFGGPVTVQVIDDRGEVIASYGVATAEQVMSHPRCTATAATVGVRK